MGSLCSFVLDQPCQHKPGSKSGNKRLFHQGHTVSLWLWPSSLSSGKEPHCVLCVWKARLNPHTYTIEGTGTAHERGNRSSARLSALPNITQPSSPRARVLIWVSLTPKAVQLLLDSEVSSATHPKVHFGCYSVREWWTLCFSFWGDVVAHYKAALSITPMDWDVRSPFLCLANSYISGAVRWQLMVLKHFEVMAIDPRLTGLWSGSPGSSSEGRIRLSHQWPGQRSKEGAIFF